MLRKSLNAVILLLSLLASADAQPRPRPRPSPIPPRPPRTVHAPEFDAKTAGAAIALLAGGALVLSERLRRKRKRD